jgi:hypothetical protein
MLILPLSVEPFGLGQSAVDHVHVSLRSGDAVFRLLLKNVQDIDGFRIADGVNSAPCAALVIRYDFDNRRASKASQWLSPRIGFALLGGVQSLADVAPHLAGESAEVSPA